MFNIYLYIVVFAICLLDLMSPKACANWRTVESCSGGYSLARSQEDTGELKTQMGGFPDELLSDEEEGSGGKLCPLSFGDGNTERGGFVRICGHWR